MKILYSIQATGNGHVSRANEILPYLVQKGDVDVFLSGTNAQLQLRDHPVKYRSKGLSLFCNKKGKLSYTKTAKQFNPFRMIKEARELPVEKYDMVINDFESITSLACTLKRVPSVSLSHQAAFQSPLTPRSKNKNWFAEKILTNYARATQYIGFHFKEYDDFIFKPIIKQQILSAKPSNKGHITVYLLCYNIQYLIKIFQQLKPYTFEVFTSYTIQVEHYENVTLFPLNANRFNESVINSEGVITGGGFETPAEVLHLGKKLLVIPIKGQYEQECNAAALEKMGVTSLPLIDKDFVFQFQQWIHKDNDMDTGYENIIPKVLEYLFETYPYSASKNEYQDAVFV
jgi:uncharacterized protein (TIGR00661 family)